MYSVKIRKGRKEDIKSVHQLIRELAIYEKAEHEHTASEEVLLENCFGENAFVDFFVAENKSNEIVGIALFYYKYSTWKGKCVFLEDLIVSEKHRQNGIGKLLLDTLIKKAQKEDLKRIEWQVLKWNTPAIKFYEKYNTTFDDEWLNCQLDEKGISKALGFYKK